MKTQTAVNYSLFRLKLKEAYTHACMLFDRQPVVADGSGEELQDRE